MIVSPLEKIEDEMSSILDRLIQNGIAIRQGMQAQKENAILRKRLRELTEIYPSLQENITVSIIKEQAY